MESWRKIWREGFAPVLPLFGLKMLAEALRSDDVRLSQRATTTPPPLLALQDYPVQGACALGFCGWRSMEHDRESAYESAVVHADELTPVKAPEPVTVGEVEEFFAGACFEADQRLGEPAACRWFLNWFDDTPRDEMRRGLLAEVERAIEERDR